MKAAAASPPRLKEVEAAAGATAEAAAEVKTASFAVEVRVPQVVCETMVREICYVFCPSTSDYTAGYKSAELLGVLRRCSQFRSIVDLSDRLRHSLPWIQQ